MKKITLFTAMFFAIGIFAQKPKTGTFTSQVGFAFATDFANINSLGLNGRYFFNESMAFRLGVGIQNDKETENFSENSDGSGSTGTYVIKENTNLFNLGFEKHFKGTSKLSPFVSFDINLLSGKSEEVGTNSGGSNFINSYNYKQTSTNNGFGVNLGLGFDYWFAEGLYIGIEYQPLAWGSITEKDSEIEINGVKSKDLGFSLSTLTTFSSNPFIRLGWRFN